MSVQFKESGPIHEWFRVPTNARPVLLVVLSDDGLDILWDWSVSRRVLKDIAAAIADSDRNDWHIAT